MGPFDYCKQSLAPIGLVTREILNPDLSTYGFQITDYGKSVGIPFCGLILDWSAKHNTYLGALWGQTSSSSPVKQTDGTTAAGQELVLYPLEFAT